ncbi:acyl-CoA dehydrogenase [Candidimonas humi]|jgi:alkylation response protein AidB-like acyl-CoA dehydrogenase|uniref:Acyl-CoA dehydrogenase n=1 Tax=Candidimonas humi TaxID=683355 RepID=A0ABV8NYX3_9BURK|nr:acyl-CoA dehydrogenase [Candidimonas humi]MBV6303958.1 acyl-CoA dehydrogenase [Candidimonas humi]
MAFDQSDLELLRDSVRDFLGRDDQGRRIRAQAAAGGRLDRDIWLSMAQAGWLAVCVPPDCDGLGLGLRETAAIAEEMGRSFVPEPFVAVAVQAATLLGSLPETELRSELLRGLAEGSLVPALAWQTRLGQTEPELPAAEPMQGAASIIGRNYVAVAPLAGADGWLALAGSQDAPLLAWVPARAPGLACQAARRIDGADAGKLRIGGYRVPARQVLARGAAVPDLLCAALDRGRVAQAAQLLGLARRVFEMTLDYMKVRVQFGKPIGSFQSLQHRMVDGYMQIQLLDYALRQALDAIEADERQLSMQASRLKVRAETAAGLVTRLAVQMHGGMGYSDEADVGLGLKRALCLFAELGNARAHKWRYFSCLRAVAAQMDVASTDAEAWPEFPQDADWESMPEADFRGMLRAFFHRHYPEHLRHKTARLHWHEIKDWYTTLSRQKWIAPAWPKEHGGMALSPAKMIAYIEEQERYGVGRPPDQGLVMLGPILLRFGTPEQQARYLPRILSGEHVWAQGYSEPGAGSDLAALRCVAVPEGEHFIVNGQKTWSTLAQDATHMFMLVRTDKTVKKQAGISFLLVDLASPGVQVRPIRTIAGDEEYCEVFFENVRVPRENLVGALNQGWTISKALLGLERLFSGSPKHSRNTLGMVEKVAEDAGLFQDAAFVSDYAQLHIDLADLSAAYAAFADVARRGEPLPPDVSLLKIWATETHERISLLLLDAAREHAGTIGNAYFAPDTQGEAPAIENVQMPLFNAAAAKIFSGTNEIQRNILAKAVLGLPV